MSIVLNQEAPAAIPSDTDSDFESSHWYSWTAEGGWFPLYGPNKGFCMREARKVQESGGIAIPSTTGYLKEVYKRMIEDYNMDGAVKASLVIPRAEYAEEKDWLKTCRNHARGRSGDAKDLGGRIHSAIEDYIAGKDHTLEMDIYVEAVAYHRNDLGIGKSKTEVCTGSTKYGYAGRCDDHDDSMYVGDIKSRKSTGKKVPVYPTDWMQVSSYGYGLFGNEFFKRGRGVVFGVSTSQPGLVTPHVKTGAELVPAFEAFLGLTQYWRYSHNYDPRIKP